MFVYDSRYPPICVQPPTDQMPECQRTMECAVTSYLKESYRHGLKHEHAILGSGLSAGEAGVLYFRDLHLKRHKQQSEPSVNLRELQDRLAEIVGRYFQINMNQHRESFNRHVDAQVLEQNHRAKNHQSLPNAIKTFLAENGLKNKGYTNRLQHVFRELETIKT